MAATHTGGRRATPPDIRAVTGAKDKTTRKQAGLEHAGSLPGKPQCPFWFSGRAHEIWDQFCYVLEARGQLCQDDYWSLCMLVSTFEEWEKLRKLVNETGYTQDVKTVMSKRKNRADRRHDEENGEDGVMTRLRPEVRLLRETEQTVRQWLGEFGLTSVTRIKAPKVGDPGDNKPNALSEWGLS